MKQVTTESTSSTLSKKSRNVRTAHGYWVSSITLAAILAVDVATGTPITDNLIVWLRADAGVTADGSNNVSAWADQAAGGGSQNATQATANWQPVFVSSSAALNNQPVIRFDGIKDSTGDRLVLGNLGGLFTSEATFFVVYTVDNTLGNNYSVYQSAGLGGTYWDHGKVGPFYGTDGAFQYRYNETGPFGDYPGIPSTGSFVVEYRAGADYTQFVDGISSGTLTALNTAGSPGGSYQFWGGDNHIIGHNSSYEPLNFRGDIAEIIIYDRYLTFDERNKVGYYLQERYGLEGSYIFIPEPTSIAILALASLAGLRRRRARKTA